jgi:16S rRNA (uracil1498-N3)-methyltransferase
MTHRYFVPQLPVAGGLVVLPEEESRHAAQVMRVRPGDTLQLFNGQNQVAMAVVQTVGRREVHCDAQPSCLDDREPPRCIVAAVSIPKGDRARMLVEKLTELGVAQLIPLVCQRSQWQPSDAALDKLRRAVIEACKQSQRNRLMQIAAPQTAATLWTHSELPDASECWIAMPSSAALSGPQAAQQGSATIVYAVGPEGGFTQQEADAAVAAGWRAVRLGPRIYRIETAALVLAAWAAQGG